MVSLRWWTTINFSLGLVILLLILPLLGIELPTLGKAQEVFNRDSPLCVVQWQDKHTSWDNIDRCCLEARKQLSCSRGGELFEEGSTDWDCTTGESTIHYRLNDKAYYYCTQQSIW